MKQLKITPVLVLMGFSICATGIKCKKDKEYCYECKNLNGNANYQDAGCMTEDQWSTVRFTDSTGNGSLDKNVNCRKK